MHAVIVVATWFAQALYALLKLLPQRRKVVFLSRQSDHPSRDFKMLASQLEALDPSIDVVVRCKFIHPGFAHRAAYLGEVLAQMYHLATSSVCVVDGYIVPVSVLSHRPTLTIVQMWHALGAIKQFGLQSVGRPSGRSSQVASAMKMHRNYDVVLCGSPAWVPAFAEAFGVEPSAVLPLGLPRVDYLVTAATALADGRPPVALQRLLARFPQLADADKTVVLYAPTFRKNAEGAYSDVAEAFSDDRFTLVVKPHDLESATLAGTNVIDASGVDVVDLILLANAVITDYSAVALEVCSAGRPLYFYVYDIDDYSAAHGLNLNPLLDVAEMSSRDIGEIAVRVAAHDYNVESVRSFCERYGPPVDGGCTRRIADMVISRLSAD